MSLPDQTPKLPKLPFLLGDVALLAAAWIIADRTADHWTIYSVAAITACVALGAVLGVIPFLTDYARKQDEALDERQRGLEALSRTINTAAEQISIAANGLNELTDLTHKNLKHADLLPHRLQEKIAEFNAQLDNAREDDREELEKELVELRAAETERLQVIADKIHRSVAELTKLDTLAQKQLAARAELVDRTNEATAKASADVTTAAHAAIAEITRELAAAQSKALAEIDAALSRRVTLAISSIDAAPSATPSSAPASAPTEISPASSDAADAPNGDAALPPKRARKPRREEWATSGAEAVSPAPPRTEAKVPVSEAPHSSDQPPELARSEAQPHAIEPPPVSPTAFVEVEPLVPPSTAPFPASALGHQAAPDAPAPRIDSAVTRPAEAAPAPAIRPPKKRAAKKTVPEASSDLGLDLPADDVPSHSSDDPAITGAEVVERVISSDGATRLIATAYIGIGNRLFIRGDGPGLNWDKGVPLQFVSIGKWRWETTDATSAIQFKLYKNDEVECSALGTLRLDPGYQQEVTTKF